MSALQKLIRNEDLTAFLTQGKDLYICAAYVEVAFVSLLPSVEAELCLWTARFVFKRIDRRFPSNCLLIPTVIPPICFLKLFVYTCQITCENAAVPCVDSAQWRLPLRSMISCFIVSCSALCVFLIQHLWVVSWLASPETWMKVSLDLSWRGTFRPPGRLLSQRSRPAWHGVLLSSWPEGVAFCYPLHCCLYLTCRCRSVSSIWPMLSMRSVLSSWCAPHHANGDAASEPDPGAFLLGGGRHHLSLVSDHHPASGSFPLPHQTCLQVRFPSRPLISTELEI